jgi:hypothetical protein
MYQMLYRMSQICQRGSYRAQPMISLRNQALLINTVQRINAIGTALFRPDQASSFAVSSAKLFPT